MGHGKRTTPNAVRFMAKVATTPGDGCWLWQAGEGTDGYGRFRLNGLHLRAHRAAWELFVGPIPIGLNVLDRCDVPKCVRIEHLFLGTTLDNIADKMAKGRQDAPRGEAHPFARLTSAAVAEIRASSDTTASLARRFGVAWSTVADARKGRRWRAA